MTRPAQGSGSKTDPWLLTTPPGTSEYAMYLDLDTEPSVLVCQVGSTTLKYDGHSVEDLHTWLLTQDT